MKSIGVIGVYREAYKIILSRRRIFTQITLSLILPLSFISLAHTQLSKNLFPKITYQNQKNVAETQILADSSYTNMFDLLSSTFTSYSLLQTAYTIFFFILSLLSTSAIVYTTACIYSGQEVTFRMVMSVVPKVWKRLIITSWSIFQALTPNYLVAVTVIALAAVLIAFGPNTNAGFVISLVVGVLYSMGFLYMSIVWQLTSTISVLEDSYGFQAMKRSNQLIRGKVGLSILILLMLGLIYYMLQKALEKVVVDGESLGMVNRVAFATACLSLLLLLSLFQRVIQTIIYFVCKSHHHEKIDKLALSDHLQVYAEELYVPLKATQSSA